MRNNSFGNYFDLGDSVAKLDAKTTLFIGEDLHDNTFNGDLGRVVDKAPAGANEY